MTIEENKESIRRWVETGWNNGDFSLLDELYTSDYLPHWVPEGVPANREGLRQFVMAYRQGMPDLRFTIDDLIGEGDKVVWRFTATGTHTGVLFGVPPTHRSASVTGTVTARFQDGKYAEDWVNFDQFGLLVQLGVIPQPEPVGA